LRILLNIRRDATPCLALAWSVFHTGNGAPTMSMSLHAGELKVCSANF
jgi:hypothetical protein